MYILFIFVFVLKLPKGITHKPFELLSSIKWNTSEKSCVTVGVILTQEKFNNSGGWLGFVGLGVLYPKRDKLCNLPCFYNFACSQTSPIVKRDI